MLWGNLAACQQGARVLCPRCSMYLTPLPQIKRLKMHVIFEVLCGVFGIGNLCSV